MAALGTNRLTPGLAWFGWFGFNGGSGFSTGHSSGIAFHEHALRPRSYTLAVSVRARRAARPEGDGDRSGDRDHRPLAARYARGRLHQPGMGDGDWVRFAALPSYAIIVWRPRTRVDETLDVLGAHGIASLAASCSSASSPRSPGTAKQTASSTATPPNSATGPRGTRQSRVCVHSHVPAATADRLGHAATGHRTRGGTRHGHRPTRRGGLRHRRGRDPRLDRGLRWRTLSRWRSPDHCGPGLCRTWSRIPASAWMRGRCALVRVSSW